MDPGPLVVAIDDPRAADVRGLLSEHLRFAHQVTPPDHVHALDAQGLVDPAVAFFSARRGGVLLGVGALRRLGPGHVELKSMHVRHTSRGQGVGRAILDHLLATAADRGYRQVSLETGTMDAFEPARRLYQAAGFQPSDPFGGYTANPHSTCMSMDLVPLGNGPDGQR